MFDKKARKESEKRIKNMIEGRFEALRNEL